MLTQTRSLVPVLGHGMISGRVSGTRQGAISSVHGVLRRLSSDRVQTCALGGALGRFECFCLAVLYAVSAR